MRQRRLRHFHVVRRLALNLLTGLSLLLCMTSAFVWVRSHRVTDDIFWKDLRRNGDGTWTARMSRVKAGGGGVWFETRHLTGGDEAELRRRADGLWPDFSWQQYRPARYPVATWTSRKWWERCGFLWGPNYDLMFVTPFWSVAVPTALLPAVRLARWRRRAVARRRQRAGRCRQCGYDLRATPDRCPECGHVPVGVEPGRLTACSGSATPPAAGQRVSSLRAREVE